MPASARDIAPVCAVVGTDRFLRQEAIDRLLAEVAEALDEVGPSRFDGASAELADVLDEVRTLSLLGGKRVVIVEDADSFVTAHRKRLERYCEAPSPGGSLVLACERLPRNTRLYRIVSAQGQVITCEAPARRTLPTWLCTRARSVHGKQLDPAATGLLLEHVGDALGLLDAELAKLSAYVGERTQITSGDIEALVGHQREEKVFGITDAMASGQPARALELWEQVLATDRAAPARALAGLAWGVRRLLEARRDLQRGVSIYELAAKLYTDAASAQRRLERVSTEALEAQLDDLLAADVALKTGGTTVGVAVEKFIVTHSAGS